VDLTQLRHGFRDEDQRRRAQLVITSRLADDREQEECRYLMKLCWQLSMTYREVTEEQLRMHLRADRFEAVEALLAAVADSPNAIEMWIRETTQAWPEIQDRGFQATQGDGELV
jgi:hypothetical protein